MFFFTIFAFVVASDRLWTFKYFAQRHFNEHIICNMNIFSEQVALNSHLYHRAFFYIYFSLSMDRVKQAERKQFQKNLWHTHKNSALKLVCAAYVLKRFVPIAMCVHFDQHLSLKLKSTSSLLPALQ